MNDQEKQDLKKANIRLALALGAVVILLFITLFMTWPGVDVPK